MDDVGIRQALEDVSQAIRDAGVDRDGVTLVRTVKEVSMQLLTMNDYLARIAYALEVQAGIREE